MVEEFLLQPKDIKNAKLKIVILLKIGVIIVLISSILGSIYGDVPWLVKTPRRFRFVF